MSGVYETRFCAVKSRYCRKTNSCPFKMFTLIANAEFLTVAGPASDRKYANSVYAFAVVQITGVVCDSYSSSTFSIVTAASTVHNSSTRQPAMYFTRTKFTRCHLQKPRAAKQHTNSPESQRNSGTPTHRRRSEPSTMRPRRTGTAVADTRKHARKTAVS